MALEYRLMIDGTTPVEEVARRALPDREERPTGIPPVLSVDLADRYGFDVSVRAGQNGYVDVDSDQGPWEWEPKAYVSVTFRMDKFADPVWEVINMLTIVRRVLGSGSEDAILVVNGDMLLLARFGGTLVKHRRARWWTTFTAANDLIPD